MGIILYDTNQSKILYDPPKVMEIKTKINKWDIINLKAFAQQRKGEKAMLRMGENNRKGNNWQSINFQNIQATHTSQYLKNK